MTRRLIWVIIVVMSIALVGLIMLQTFWLHQEFELKEEQFNQQITEVFNAINKELDAKETVVEVTNEVFSLRYKVNDLPSYSLLNNVLQYSGDSSRALAVRKNFLAVNDSLSIHTNTRVEILKGDSVLFSKTVSKCKPDNYCKSVTNIDLNKEIANKLTDKTMFVEKIINKMLNFNDDIRKRVDYFTLYNIVQKQLRNHQIYLTFEIALKSDSGNIIYKTPHFDKNYADVFKTQLFPNDVFSPAYYLVLYFPEKDNFIASSLGFMGVLTIILILIIVFSYSLTLYTILHQKKLSEMKNDFVNNMTHELKTPISTISLASQMLNDRSICKNGDQILNVSNIIAQETKRLAFQVEKVLQMAIFERGEYRFNKQLVHVNALVENITSTFNLHVKKRNGQLFLMLDAMDDQVLADELHLSNAIVNLLENALKYSKDDPIIELSTYNKDNTIIISVKDNGIGISKQDQKHVFEKFYRVHTGNIHNVKGFGLGLSYVKIIAEAHQGSVKVQSELNKGSEFQIILPINKTI
ncbi:MAG: HAMP domain-containing sensor histidine kinase [Bacteroidales bacterium]